MKKIKTMKKTILSLCVTALGCITVGVVALLPAQAEDAMTVSEAVSTFVMEEGAAIRKGDTKQGIRFNALLSEQAYEVLESAQAEFGMLIVPKDYVTEGYELTAENVFGENAVYQANVKASEVEEGKKAIIQITEPTIRQVDDEYKIYGSLVGVLNANLARGFIGTAYVCVNGEYYLADYADGLVENNTRSMAYVAKRAIEAGDEDSATLQTKYIDPVKDKSFNYTVNKVTVDFDGSIEKETVVSSTAQFATPIQYGTDALFGFNGEGVDSFVGMENAEFNVVYTATPVSVVVDADATATETYAAEELALYISQVTGSTVSVVSQETGEYNNIYVSTDAGLGLAADSFKLSYDANGNVHINGVDDRGTLYGVYEYEESYLGIKFLSENYTHVPVTNKQVSSVAETKTYTPSFAYRTYMNNGVGFYDDANVKYSSHLRFISQFSNERAQSDLMNKVQYTMPWMAQGWLQASHSILAYAAIGAYQSGATDILTYTVGENGLLTYCAFNDSATSSSYKSAFDTSGSMLDVCYSNSTAKAWVKAGLKYAMENYPEMEYFMLGQADKRTNCSCTDCWLARLKGANKSWLIANFVKEMATYTNSLGYTDKKVVMFAYQDTEVAPTAGRNSALTDMPSNVYVQWAPVDSDRYFGLDTTNIEGWKTALGMTDGRFLVWSYEVDFYSYFTYYPTMQTWVENFMTYKELGVELVMMQSSHNTSGIADSYLEAYVASKLLWNFDETDGGSMDSLIESAKAEFIEYFYGSAAKDYVLAYYDEFDTLYAEKFGADGYTGGEWSFTEAELNSLLDLLNQAINATSNETYVNHLNMLALTPRYMLVKYCQTTDNTLANDISSVATLTAEGTSVANDVNLQGLSFTKGNTTIYNVKYDENNRVVGMSVDMPHDTEWSWNAPRFTAEYLDELYHSGVRYVVFEVASTTQTNNFITYYGTTLDFDANDGFKVTLIENGSELKFSYVDLSTGNTVGTTLDLLISYYSEGQEAAGEIGLTLATNVVVSKDAEANTYTLSNTNGMNSAYFSADQVNAWMAAGYDAISMNVSFTPAGNMTKVVAMNGSSFATMKALLTDETGNAAWTFILAEDTPIHIWAQNGDNNSSGAFTLANVALLTHQLSGYAYDESNHWSVCAREGCHYVGSLAEHSYGYTYCIGAIDYGCTVCGYVQSRENVDEPTIDFTTNTYGASVDSVYLGVGYASQVTTTADTLQYALFEDGSVGVKALNKVVLPCINFANFDRVSINVTFNTFTWEQQFGLTEDGLVNISDTWVAWASYEGTLTFEWVNDSLVMTLAICNRTLTWTITDENIINGKTSAYFYVQAYYTNSTVTLSGFTFKAPCAEHTYGDWTMGSATGMKKHACTNCGYEEEVACTEHTFGNVTVIALGLGTHTCTLCNTVAEVAIDEPVYDFTSNMYGATVYSCVWAAADDTRITEKTADSLKYLVYHDNGEVNALSKLYLPKINFANFDKVTVNVFFDTFAWNQQYGLTEDALTNISDTWVDWNSYNGTLTFEWVDGSLVMTLVMNGKTLSQTITDEDVIKGKASAYFCAQAYYDRYVTLSAFEFGNVCAHEYGDWTMGSTVGMKKHTCSLCGEDEEVACTEHAYSDWNANLDTATKERTCSICAYVETVADENNVYGVQYGVAGETTVSNTQYDKNNRIVSFTAVMPDGVDWSKNDPFLNAAYLNKLYAEGVRRIEVSFDSTAAGYSFITFYNNILDYDPRDGYTVTLAENAGNLRFSYVDLNTGNTVGTTLTISISYYFDPQAIADEIGATVANGVNMAKEAEGVYTVSNTNGYQGGLMFSAEQVNAWLAEGYTSITFTLSFTASDTIDKTVAYSASHSFMENTTGNATWTINLKAGEAIDIWAQKNGANSTGAFTISNIKLNLSPAAIAGEIGLTLYSGVSIVKDAEGVYTLSNMSGYQGGAAFSAEQVNAWLAAGYVSISMNVSFTAGADIDTVVAYSASTGFVTDSTGNATWTFTLKSGEAIDFWVQKSGAVSSGAFTMSNITLKKQPPYAAGYTTVSNEVYDANDYLTGMTMVIPDNTEWSGNSPYFTQAYLNSLYADGVRYITLDVESTTAGYSFITVYNGAANYAAAGSTIAIVENGGDLKFSHVNLNNGGYTVATTLTFAISYQLDPAIVAAEIGLTLYDGVNIAKTGNDAYTVSDTNGYQGGVVFSAEQVNAWILQGYTQLTFSVSFTAGADISKVVGYGPTAGWLIDETGSATWTIALGADSPIDFWAQSGDTPSTGAFTISGVALA